MEGGGETQRTQTNESEMSETSDEHGGEEIPTGELFL